MIMQLSADPTHEYGSCGGDSGDSFSGRVCDACIYCILLHVFTCVPDPYDLTDKLYACPHTSAGVKAFVCLYLPGLAPTGAKKSIN